MKTLTNHDVFNIFNRVFNKNTVMFIEKKAWICRKNTIISLNFQQINSFKQKQINTKKLKGKCRKIISTKKRIFFNFQQVSFQRFQHKKVYNKTSTHELWKINTKIFSLRKAYESYQQFKQPLILLLLNNLCILD